MAVFLTKAALTGELPYPSSLESRQRKAHEEGVKNTCQAIARSLVAAYRHRKPTDTFIEVRYFHTPRAYRYLTFLGQETFLGNSLAQIVGLQDEAHAFYLSHFQEAFPDMSVTLLTHSVPYEYFVCVKTDVEPLSKKE